VLWWPLFINDLKSRIINMIIKFAYETILRRKTDERERRKPEGNHQLLRDTVSEF
jgi:hypothetical protein